MGLYNTSLVAGAICRHGRIYPGHPRLTAAEKKDVDARDKPGHDVEGFVFRH